MPLGHPSYLNAKAGGLFKTPCGCADLGVLPLVTDLLDHLDGEF